MLFSYSQRAFGWFSRGRSGKGRKRTPIRLPRFVPAMEKLEDRTLLTGNFGLDSTFGSGGKVTFNFSNNDDEAYAVALQGDGKIVVAGSTQVSGTNYDFALSRLNSNGTPDTTFNGTGKLTIPFDLGGGNKDRAYGVVLQPDGKILVVGSAQTSSTGYVFAVARVNADGSLDGSFNGSGKQTISMGVGLHNDQAFGVALEPDNKIVVVGFSQISSTNYDFAVARLNTNGSLDTTFNNSGKRTIAFDIGGGFDDEAKGVAIQSDGKIVVAGFAQVATNTYDFAVARLNVNGTLDTGFNGTGKEAIGFNLGGANNDGARSVAIQKDGKIVLGGYAEISAPHYAFALARLNPDGSLDPTFNGGGKQSVSFNLGGGFDDEATGLSIQPDSKIIVTGLAEVGSGNFNFAVARLTPNGSLDPAFNGGKYTFAFNLRAAGQDEAFAAVVQPDSKIVVAGFAQRTTSAFNFAVCRVDPGMVKYFAISGAPGRVRVYNMAGALITDFAPYGTFYRGGVSVAFGDVNGDGVMDLITGATTGSALVKVFSGENFRNGTFSPTFPDASLLASFYAYGQQFNVGANVAAGDIEGSGYADIVTGASAGNPHVKVFRGKDIAAGRFHPESSSLVAQFFPYALQFNVGSNVAVGDLSANGFADVVTGANVGNPHVRVFDGKSMATGSFNPDTSQLASFFAYGLNFNVGAFVAVGDVNGDGYPDLITGASVGNPQVNVYNGRALFNHTFDNNHPERSELTEFFAFEVNQNIGVSVGAADLDGTGRAQILTGSRATSRYRIVSGLSTGILPPAFRGMEGIAPTIQGGIFISC